MLAVKGPAAAWYTSAAAGGAVGAVGADDQRAVYRPALAWRSGYPGQTLERLPATQSRWGWGTEFLGAGQPLNRRP